MRWAVSWETRRPWSAFRRIRALRDDHNFTLVCRDLSELGTYARVDNTAYRLLRYATPGPYTFILEATRDVPKRLVQPKRKTIGLRVPDHPIPQALLHALDEPVDECDAGAPGGRIPDDRPRMTSVISSSMKWTSVIDGGFCGLEATSVVDLTGPAPIILRRGVGDVSDFEAA
jgi:tRNA threonylcarbamoyl adenosine modification protein (Sua5/YciO/YrdC/YwlC family)